jgi:hypothetical protein
MQEKNRRRIGWAGFPIENIESINLNGSIMCLGQNIDVLAMRWLLRCCADGWEINGQRHRRDGHGQ